MGLKKFNAEASLPGLYQPNVFVLQYLHQPDVKPQLPVKIRGLLQINHRYSEVCQRISV
jgi:hypothetical protein